MKRHRVTWEQLRGGFAGGKEHEITSFRKLHGPSLDAFASEVSALSRDFSLFHPKVGEDPCQALCNYLEGRIPALRKELERWGAALVTSSSCYTRRSGDFRVAVTLSDALRNLLLLARPCKAHEGGGAFGSTRGRVRYPKIHTKKAPLPVFTGSGANYWRRPTFAQPRDALSSGLQRFTSVFGMGTGGATALRSPEV
jgi:hypothetical protein